MAEYIERDKLLEYFDLCNKQNPRWTPQRVKTLLVRESAADVAPVAHGRWEDVYGGKYQNKRYLCTVCKEKALFKFYQDDLLTWSAEQKLSNYCPNCGARMDGE